jgi:type IV pilus assembly protein PilA
MKKNGFTLIELLLVLAIIGIISAIAIPALLGQREAARNKATASNCANVRGAIVNGITALELPTDQRPLDLVAAADVPAVLLAVAGRDEYLLANAKSAKNPFDAKVAAYTFAAAAPTVAGNSSISAVQTNAATGMPEIGLGYGIRKRGVEDLTPRLNSIDASM